MFTLSYIFTMLLLYFYQESRGYMKLHASLFFFTFPLGIGVCRWLLIRPRLHDYCKNSNDRLHWTWKEIRYKQKSTDHHEPVLYKIEDYSSLLSRPSALYYARLQYSHKLARETDFLLKKRIHAHAITPFIIMQPKKLSHQPAKKTTTPSGKKITSQLRYTRSPPRETINKSHHAA